ncbi:MAG TPA: HI0074 family nucleotidyltransferase substrate-binding subunit [Chlamydiales bacterium]|jgi:nucleotidyltransferase substrate binding protein (TIGR01987 family)|nr:HI0074 family nucleotidyltransferase substrate-binding subunit [Chlamydiales bacterium]
MNQDIRWQQRFENLEKARDRLHEALKGTAQEPNNHLYQIALIGAFQSTFELSWKTMKDYLAYNGVTVSLPRDVIKQAFHHQLVQDGQVWIDMLEDRNLMAHVYQEKAALEAVRSIRERYAPAIERIHNYLLKRRIV